MGNKLQIMITLLMKKINGKRKKQEWHDALMDEIDAEIPRVSPTYYNEEEEDLY